MQQAVFSHAAEAVSNGSRCCVEVFSGRLECKRTVRDLSEKMHVLEKSHSAACGTACGHGFDVNESVIYI